MTQGESALIDFDVGAPAGGPELRTALATALARGTALVQPFSDQQFFAPQGTFWSPAEHIRHLRRSSTPLVTALRLPKVFLQLRWGTHSGPSRSFDEMHRIYLEKLAAGATAGAFTPPAESMPSHPADRRTEIVSAWTAATVALDQEMARWSEESLDRYRLPHPALGRLTVREMLAFTVFHTVHHLRRIAERA